MLPPGSAGPGVAGRWERRPPHEREEPTADGQREPGEAAPHSGRQGAEPPAEPGGQRQGGGQGRPGETRPGPAVTDPGFGQVLQGSRKSKRIVSPWSQEFTDLYGLHQDYPSTQRGMKAAVAAGVLEIQSHGWTHMQPDLDSPPGPWWTADLAGEASASGWYEEFNDERRGSEIPAIVQQFRLTRSLEYLQKDFGQRPLEFRPGGFVGSNSYFNHTGRLAAQAGFGMYHVGVQYYDYLDHGLILDMMGIAPETLAAYDRPLHAELWPPHPDGPVMIVFHDRDIALQPDFIERLFAALPAGYQTVSTNQYIGLLHVRIDSVVNGGWQIKFLVDEPYCDYLGSHASSWRVWLSDPLREKLSALGSSVITLDGKTLNTVNASGFIRENVTIDLPAGLGNHVWTLRQAR